MQDGSNSWVSVINARFQKQGRYITIYGKGFKPEGVSYIKSLAENTCILTISEIKM